MGLHFQFLEPDTDTADFDCGVEALNHFIRKHALINQSRGLGNTTVALLEGRVVGFFTLSPAAVARSSFPNKYARGLPYREIGVVKLGRLAVDLRNQGQGIGRDLLMHAMRAALKQRRSIGGFAMVVDAKDKLAVRFYESFDFQPFVGLPQELFLTMKTIASLLEAAEEEINAQTST